MADQLGRTVTSRRKILYAEDSPVFQAAVKAALLGWGYDVELVSNGHDALACLARPGGPRLAILDWSLPGLDGDEVCRLIRAGQYDSYVYVIMLTGRADSEDLLAGMEAGAD